MNYLSKLFGETGISGEYSKLEETKIITAPEEQITARIEKIQKDIDNVKKELNLGVKTPHKYVKKAIPIAIKSCVWGTYIGMSIGSAPCPIGCGHVITQNAFHCGHVIAEANGGETSVANMRPICEQCNKSMGTTDMNDFIKMYGAAKRCGLHAQIIKNGILYCGAHGPRDGFAIPEKCMQMLKSGKSCQNKACKFYSSYFYCGVHCKDPMAKNIECQV